MKRPRLFRGLLLSSLDLQSNDRRKMIDLDSRYKKETENFLSNEMRAYFGRLYQRAGVYVLYSHEVAPQYIGMSKDIWTRCQASAIEQDLISASTEVSFLLTNNRTDAAKLRP